MGNDKPQRDERITWTMKGLANCALGRVVLFRSYPGLTSGASLCRSFGARFVPPEV